MAGLLKAGARTGASSLKACCVRVRVGPANGRWTRWTCGWTSSSCPKSSSSRGRTWTGRGAGRGAGRAISGRGRNSGRGRKDGISSSSCCGCCWTSGSWTGSSWTSGASVKTVKSVKAGSVTIGASVVVVGAAVVVVVVTTTGASVTLAVGRLLTRRRLGAATGVALCAWASSINLFRLEAANWRWRSARLTGSWPSTRVAANNSSA